MNQLAQHIEALLLENDCVILPGFGGFVTHYTPSVRMDEEHRFLAPSRKIGFNAQLKLNDGVLVQSYMSVYDTNFSDAGRRVEQEIAHLVESLHENGKVDLENIGELHYTINGTYEFVPYDYKYVTPDLYGLDSFEMSSLLSLQEAKERSAHAAEKSILVKTVVAPSNSDKRSASDKDLTSDKRSKNAIEFRISTALLRNAVAMIAAVFLFFFFSTPIENTTVGQAEYARLIPTELLEVFDGGNRGATGFTQKVAVRKVENEQKAHSVAAVKTDKPSLETISQKLTSKDVKTSHPIKVKEIKVSASETPKASSTSEIVSKSSTTSATPSSGRQAEVTTGNATTGSPYHIIVASSIKQGAAQALLEQLKKDGYTHAQVLKGGVIRVSISSYSTYQEANKQLNQLNKNEAYKTAWILRQ